MIPTILCCLMAVAGMSTEYDIAKTTATDSTAKQSTVNYDELTMAWHDEFEGTQVDMTKWNYRALGTTRTFGVVDKRTIEVDGQGFLHIKVLKEEPTGTYYIGEIGTQKLFSQKYGYFECRAKMNTSLGPHVAFWLQSPTMSQVGDPATNGAEIDIFEYHCRTPNIVYHNIHWDGYGTDHKTAGMKVTYPQITDGFHTFGLKWTPSAYTFYIDGKETWTCTVGVSQRDEYLILSTELNGWGGDPKLGTFPDEVVFDYVRVYKFNDITGISQQTISTNKSVSQAIYSIDGSYVGTQLNSLQKGIYIQDGKKILVN